MNEEPKQEAPKAEPYTSPFRESAQQKQDRARKAAYGGYHENTGAQHAERSPEAKRDSKTIGIILVALGALILLKYFIPRISTTIIFAVACIAVGLYFILRRK